MNYFDFIDKFVTSSPFFPYKDNIITGCNGLYGETETSYRILSHWSMLLNDCSLDTEFLSGFVDLFLSEFYKHDLSIGPYKARYSEKKDTSNGLIGTAWNVEGIISTIMLCNKLHDKDQIKRDLIDLLPAILKHYSYNEHKSNWPNIIEPNGEKLGLDRTFNHQLWFATSKLQAGIFLDDEDISYDASKFLDNLAVNLKHNHVGAFYHTLGSFPHYHKTLIKRLISSKYRKDMLLKEYGYHGFNLLGLVRAFDYGRLELKSILERELKITTKKRFIKNQNDNKYGSSYNPVGLEIAAAISKLKYNDNNILFWLNYHFANFFDSKNFVFCNSSDIPTLNARLYEMTYLNNKTKDILRYDLNENLWCFVE
ncbi:TPA: hypothetical protein NJ059_002503 [Vibrio parahaemolyticus]|nr:hypothetical protein [Vibrio parahaemolyticus]